MGKTVHAVFANGVIRPTEPLDLPDPCELEIQVCVVQPAGGERRRFWREIHGNGASLLGGEDAQAWVSRGRREADERRIQAERGDR